MLIGQRAQLWQLLRHGMSIRDAHRLPDIHNLVARELRCGRVLAFLQPVEEFARLPGGIIYRDIASVHVECCDDVNWKNRRTCDRWDALALKYLLVGTQARVVFFCLTRICPPRKVRYLLWLVLKCICSCRYPYRKRKCGDHIASGYSMYEHR